MNTSILVSTFPPFPTLAFSLPSDTPLATLPPLIYSRLNLNERLHHLTLSLNSGPLPLTSNPLSTLHDVHGGNNPLVTLRLTVPVLGGKGGFGSQLRAAGGRMSSQKTNNNDSCRDLNGRRLSTVKEAQKLAKYIEDEPIRKKAAAEAQKAKLEALERQIGFSSGSGSGEPSSVAGKKHRFEDTVFLEQSQDIVDNVKSAVAAGLLKKRKKAKLADPKEGGEKKAVTAATVPSVPVEELKETPHVSAAA